MVTRAVVRTNQMGYIKVKAQLPGIYGNVNPWRLCFNYYIAVITNVNLVVYPQTTCLLS